MLPSIFSQKPLFIRMTIGFLVAALILMLLDSKNPEWFSPLRSLSHASMQPIYQVSVGPSYAMEYAQGLGRTPWHRKVLPILGKSAA